MRHPVSYPYRVTREDLRIPVAEGVELHARIWRPVTEQPVPALLEYLPSRLGDATAERDAERHPWYAGHGYASVRVDLRGHGNSDGLPGEEYGAQELADGLAVLDWLAGQPWCTGRLGLIGIGWGAGTALRLAALAPEPLRAVVTVGASDDHYDNDTHYFGGSLLGPAGHARSAALLAFAARPPDPKYVGEQWRPRWLERLAAVEPYLFPWLAHQSRDDYWRRAGIIDRYGSIKAAVLAVGGWADPSRDTVLRLVEHLDAPVRGLIGPWARQYPDRARQPGPAIGFLQETLRWWDQWLKETDTGILAEPALRCWLGEPGGAGRWVGDDQWPSDDVREIHYGLADTLRTAGTPEGERFVPVRSPQHTGVDAGQYVALGSAADLPPDQREEDGRSVCFDSAPLAERLELLGRPAVRLRLRCAAPRGQVIARLCAVAPDGASTLITRGALNLAARHGREVAVPWEPGAVAEVEFELLSAGFAVPPGHRLRLALSSAYWPWLWPQPEDAGFDVDPGPSVLTLPVRHLAADVGRAPITFAEPEQATPLAVRHGTPTEPHPERLVVRDLAAGEWRLELNPRTGGSLSHPDGLACTEQATVSCRIRSTDPVSAATHAEWTIRLERPEHGWDVTVLTRSELACDAETFTARSRLTAWEGGAVVFERDWERRIPRTAG
ncbi:putative CocE/NonD family hydrolase [Kitasatospora sp. GAS204A]|uniref:CocE/NonD family hydrolase n=1 Tax=unclassified Kitasatospora TaxID=2633591 RepID=UPI0024749F40|nr:CocE/NonD family hydrolase [Kitasatospora sp. GAS204B]MDH6116114.1 putative CocE/NonD family hydrolase [Kitasatospora sp. GAS204B]